MGLCRKGKNEHQSQSFHSVRLSACAGFTDYGLHCTATFSHSDFGTTAHILTETPPPTLKPDSVQPTLTVAPHSIVQPLPQALEALYLRADGQFALMDLSGALSAALTRVLTQTDPRDEPNIWLQFHLSTPPQVSPAGNRLLLPDGSGGWWIYDLTGRTILKQFSADAAITSPSFSPRGERLAFIQEGRLCLYSFDSNSTACLPPFEAAPLFAGWSSFSDHIAIVLGACCEAEVWLVDAAALESRPVGFTNLAFETNLSRVLGWVYDENTEEEKLVILSQKDASQALIYSPSRSTASQLDFSLAGISANGKYILTLDGKIGTPDGDFSYTLAEQPATVLLKDWARSPKGDRLAVIHTQPDRADVSVTLSVIDLSEKNLLWERTFDFPFARVEWSRDSSTLLLDQADLRAGDSPVWKIKADGEGDLKILVEAGFLLKVLH